MCFATCKCVLHDLITMYVPFKFVPKSTVNENYHGLKTLCPCSFDRTHFGFDRTWTCISNLQISR